MNPVAGIGGRVGLKGSDGDIIQRRACELGAVPRSGSRAVQALLALTQIQTRLTLLTCPGAMGADAALDAGFSPRIIDGLPADGATTSDHTILAAGILKSMGVDLLLFAGGDGTARDIYNGAGHDFPALGIPAGVKMQSAVYGITPERTGTLALEFLSRRTTRLSHREIMDLDENALRGGTVIPNLYGYLMVPEEKRYLQYRKSPSFGNETAIQAAIAKRVKEEIASDRLYIIGPGTTTRVITDAIGIEGTLIGVDVIQNSRLLIKDANESQLLKVLEEASDAAIIVTLIGGQGFLFGRGNQQISPQVIRRVGAANIHIVATPQKIITLRGRPMLIDTGDSDIDNLLSGYRSVITGFNDRILYRAVA